MNKCQVKDCENEAIGFICDHDEGEHDICQECIDKYYTNKKTCDCICGCEREAMMGADLCLECTHGIATKPPKMDNTNGFDMDLRESISLSIGIVLVYFSLVLETIYGEENYKKIDKLMCRFFDWIEEFVGDCGWY